jgi:hypothetical protein
MRARTRAWAGGTEEDFPRRLRTRESTRPPTLVGL